MLSRAGKRITCTGRLRKKQSQTPLDTTINTTPQSAHWSKGIVGGAPKIRHTFE